MKIPLEHEPFAPVVLTPGQEQQLQWLSDALLEETLVENQEFVVHQNRTLDKSRWKQVMSRENLIIYKRAGKSEQGGTTPDVNLFKPHSEPRSRRWRLPLCVGVGTLAGSLDDLLYGALAPTAVEYKVRTTYTKDDAADTRVLATIVRPTEIEPMRSMSVRWTLLCQTMHKMIVSPRDVVHLDSMGTKTLPNGERIGYILHQSIDLPGCGELEQLGLIRATYSTGYIFRDTGNGSIEVYMRAYMDPGGKLSDSIAVTSACAALASIGRMTIAGQSKKLAYMVRTHLVNKSRPSSAVNANVLSAKGCPLCSKSISGLRSPMRCDVCQIKMCSRCVDKKKLTHIVLPNNDLVRVPTLVCKACTTAGAKLNAIDVAISEQVLEARRTVRLHSTATSSSGCSRRRSPSVSAFHSTGGSSYATQLSDTASIDSTSGYNLRVLSSVSHSDDDCYSVATPSYSRQASGSVATSNSEDEATTSTDQARVDLWVRMNQLRVAAEEAYQTTKHNGAVMADATNTSDPWSTQIVDARRFRR